MSQGPPLSGLFIFILSRGVPEGISRTSWDVPGVRLLMASDCKSQKKRKGKEEKKKKNKLRKKKKKKKKKTKK